MLLLLGTAVLRMYRARVEYGGVGRMFLDNAAVGSETDTSGLANLTAELLGADEFTTMAETGHLPMDERPEETAKLLLDFFEGA